MQSFKRRTFLKSLGAALALPFIPMSMGLAQGERIRQTIDRECIKSLSINCNTDPLLDSPFQYSRPDLYPRPKHLAWTGDMETTQMLGFEESDVVLKMPEGTFKAKIYITEMDSYTDDRGLIYRYEFFCKNVEWDFG